MKKLIPTALKLATALVACCVLNACAAQPGNQATLVENAYNTAGLVPLKPYTRTIFSSTDF